MTILKPEDFLDIHVGMPCVLVGHGPSLEKDRIKIQQLQLDGKVIRFSVNNWWHFLQVPPTYYLLCNTDAVIENTYKITNQTHNYTKAVFYCDCLDPIDHNFIEKNCIIDHVPYDQRHHSGKVCDPFDTVCCPHVRDRLSIQEIVAKKTGYKELRTNYVSSIFMAYYFAIIMGCNPIYFSGVDLSWGADGYATMVTGQKLRSLHFARQGCSNADADLPSHGPSYDKIVGDSMNHVMNIAKAADTQVYNLNPDAWYGIIPPADLSIIK